MSLLRLGQGMAVPANQGAQNAPLTPTIPSATYINNAPIRGIEPIAGFNGVQGVLYMSYTDTSANVGDNSVLLTISDGSSSNRIFIQKRSANGGRFRVASQASGQTNEIWDGYLQSFPNGTHAIAVGWSANDLRVWVNGMLLCRIEGDFVNTTFSQIDLGQFNGGSNGFSGTVNECRYYDQFLSDAQGRALTQNRAILSGPVFDPMRKIYMFLGQSNSVGQATGSPSYTNTTQMFLLSHAMSVVPYSDSYADPTNAAVQALDNTGSGGTSVGYAGYFADALSQLTNEEVTVCPANISGSSFAGVRPIWPVESEAYRVSGTKIKGMMATVTGAMHQMILASQFGVVEAIIWGQGEGDASSGTSQVDYQNYLAALINETRGVLDNTNVPWYNVGMPSYHTDIAPTRAMYDAITNAQEVVANAFPNVYVVDSTNIDGNTSDRVHYDLAGVEVVGQTIAHAVHASTNALNVLYSTDGSERTIDISGAPYVGDTGGFMWLQFTSNNTPTGNEYPLILDNGTTANLMGIRLYSGQPYAGYWIRGNGVNLASTHMSLSGVPAFTEGARRTVGLSWSNITGKAYIYSGGFIREIDISAQDITGLSRLSVVSRGGSGALDGFVHAFEIGDQYISPAQMETRIQARLNRMIVAGAGQSLERGALVSQESGSDAGYQALVSTLAAEVPTQEVLYYGRGEGGASLFKQNNSVNEYWWDEDTDIPGTMLQRLYDELDDGGLVPTHLSWAQGEQDALFLNMTGRPIKADYKAKLQLLFQDMRARYGDVQIYIKIIGRRTSGNVNEGGTQDIRDVQIELINALPYVHFATEQYHVPLFDSIHPSDVGYVDIFTQQAKSMAASISYPSLVSAVASGSNVTVILSNDINLPSNTNVNGFSYIASDGNEIDITNAMGTGNSVTLTLASTPIDQNGTLYYVYDDASDLNIAQIIESSGTEVYPMRSGKIENV